MSEYYYVSVTSKYLDSLKNKIAGLEQQNKELKASLKQCMTWLRKESKSMPNYDITQSVLWQNFEKMLNTGGER